MWWIFMQLTGGIIMVLGLALMLVGTYPFISEVPANVGDPFLFFVGFLTMYGGAVINYDYA